MEETGAVKINHTFGVSRRMLPHVSENRTSYSAPSMSIFTTSSFSSAAKRDATMPSNVISGMVTVSVFAFPTLA
jgi:hypothetical protein